MKTKNSMRVCLAIAGLVSALVCGGCSTMAPKGVDSFVAPPLGSTFTYSQSNTGSFGSETKQVPQKVTERTWEGKQMVAIVSPAGVILLDADGAIPAILGPNDAPILSFDPPMGYDYPLTVDKTWTKRCQITVGATKQAMPLDNTFRIEAYEELTVPAGKFKALKITNSNSAGEEFISWHIPELGQPAKRVLKRTAKFPRGPGTREEELVSYTIAK
jgi:hypothetical protein